MAVAALAATASCGDTTPPAGPGTVTATLVSPNGAEGAAVLSLFGDGVGEITAVGTGAARVWSLRRGDSVRVVLVRDDGGELAFRMALNDTTQKPGAVVLEVAGADDRLRAALGDYTVTFR